MKKYTTFVGIDISKSSLDICLLHADHPKEMKYERISNDEKSIRKFLKTVTVENIIFCMEDTGVYGLPLCYLLDELGLDYTVVPAIHIKRSKGLKRGKTDKTDAKDIASYVFIHIHEIKLSHLPEEDLQELKLLLSERDKLVTAIKMFESTKETLPYFPKKTCSSTRKNNDKTLRQLKNQLMDIEETLTNLTRSNETMNEQMILLQSIPGIGPQTSLLLISYTRCFTSFDNWRQFACYVGIAPFEYQSGTSIKGKTKVSHFAQKRLKSAIHLAALTSKKYDAEIKKYFEKKVEEGKNKMLVLNAIRCKLIARAFAVINRKTPFVNTQKFAA
ncbi:MAG TPA: IS110 family transposase [Niabella sp.]|nr:IS110 family transposase [Niabella sp.]